MRILILSKTGSGLSIAHAVQREGHSALVHIPQKGYEYTGDGVWERVESWRPVLHDCDAVVADTPQFGIAEEYVKRSGKPFMGFSKGTDVIHLSPMNTRVLCNWYDLPAMPDEDRLVELAENRGNLVGVNIQGWWNGREWIAPLFLIHNEHNLMDGGRGPLTESMGATIRPLRFRTRLAQKTIRKLTTFMKGTSYRGPVNFLVIVEGEGEEEILTTRIICGFSYDALEAFAENEKAPLTDILFETAVGKTDEFCPRDNYAIAVRVSIPPWPYAPAGRDDGELSVEISGLSEENQKHIYFCDAYEEVDGKMYAGDGHGVVMKVTARGNDVREARRRVYRTLENLHIPYQQYRGDIGRGADVAFDRLEKWGWLSQAPAADTVKENEQIGRSEHTEHTIKTAESVA